VKVKMAINQNRSVIWKFPFTLEDAPILYLPKWAKVIHAGLDPCDTCCIWAEVNPLEDIEERQFYVIGTGNDFTNTFPEEEAVRHISRFNKGPFVWHFYEKVINSKPEPDLSHQ